MSALEVWDCRRCHSIRSAPCGGVCLPGDTVSRESTRPLATHTKARPAFVAWAESVGYTSEEVGAMPTNELIALYQERQAA